MTKEPALSLLKRPRLNRKSLRARRLVRESTLIADDLIWPLFLIDSRVAKTPVAHMPGVDRLNIDEERAVIERLMAFKRAGCDGVLTYFAPEAAARLKSGA